MTQNSQLKTEFPLSSRKFKKKMIEKGILFFIVGIIVATFGSIMATEMGLQNTIWPILWGVGIFVLPMIVYGIYMHYYIKMYYYEDDQDFLTIRKGVITPAQIHVQYAKIQDVYVDQDILDRILGIYDVHISSATYTSGIAAHIDGVSREHAEGLKNLLLHKIKGGSAPARQTENASSVSEGSTTDASTQPVYLSKPVSSAVYGLGKNWWLGEYVKVAIGAVVTPALIAAAFTFKASKGTLDSITRWDIVFWGWFGLVVLTIVWRLGYLWLWKSHYKYDFGSEYIYMKTGVISVSEQNLGYNSIQDVRIRQGFVDRIFGVADLIIENAAGNMVIPTKGGRAQETFNGIVVEGLSLTDARDIAEELKKVITKKYNTAKGL